MQKKIKQTEKNTIAGYDNTKDIVNESYLQTVFRRFKRHHLATVSFIVLAVLCGAAILAPVIAPEYHK